MFRGDHVVIDTDFGRAPAGWYPDPMGLPQLRWWDSIGWTEDVAEARQPMVMRETAERRFAWADDEMPTRRSQRERRKRERDNPHTVAAGSTQIQVDRPRIRHTGGTDL